jgi:hypothetical protein
VLFLMAFAKADTGAAAVLVDKFPAPACIIMPLGFMLSFSWVAVHRPLSAACQHRPA